MSAYVKVFGVPRTSTTFLESLLIRNLKVGSYVTHYGNKHLQAFTLEEMHEWAKERPLITERFSHVLEDVIHPLIVIKNPYSWYQSIKRFRKGNFKIGFDYRKYNESYREWKKLLDNPWKPFGKGFVMRYEDTLRNAEAVLTNISKQTGIPMKGKVFTIPTKVSQSDEFTEERKKFYLSNGNFGLSNELIKQITKAVDWNLMKFYGYEPKEIK